MKTAASGIVSAILALFLSFPAIRAYAEPGPFDEYAVKAAFLYNFAKFVEWPPSSFKDSHAQLIIYIIGIDPFGDKLDVLADKTVSGRKLLIRRVAAYDDLGKCHILFISRSEKDQLGNILKAIKNRNVLTVSELNNFCSSGGIINLFLEGDRVRFEINQRAAERAGLKISSHLLNLAKVYREEK
ncbi:MAG: YfiR family protein [Nitrospirae bacterium]|nr:YfiR family protein [Nitrospirota bacterium]